MLLRTHENQTSYLDSLETNNNNNNNNKNIKKS